MVPMCVDQLLSVLYDRLPDYSKAMLEGFVW